MAASPRLGGRTVVLTLGADEPDAALPEAVMAADEAAAEAPLAIDDAAD